MENATSELPAKHAKRREKEPAPPLAGFACLAGNPTASNTAQLNLTPVEVLDLRMLRIELLRFQPNAFNKSDRARDAVRYLAVIEKILNAV